jgi:hypothetical protein
LGKYAVFGSGPMGIRGIREMHDIDLVVTQDLFDRFRSNSAWEVKDIYGNNDCFHGLINHKLNIEMFTKWYTDWNTEKLIKEAEMIDDMPFVKLDYVIQWKKQFASEKDLRDVNLIKQFKC